MKAHGYSWRLSEVLKSDIERKMPVSSLLELAVREWLKRSSADSTDSVLQKRLHASAEACVGAFASGNLRRAESARKTLRAKLKNRRNAR
jgi:hypothetical protein